MGLVYPARAANKYVYPIIDFVISRLSALQHTARGFGFMDMKNDPTQLLDHVEVDGVSIFYLLQSNTSLLKLHITSFHTYMGQDL